MPKRFVVDGATYDRSGRLAIDEFLVEPDDAVIDPLLDLLDRALASRADTGCYTAALHGVAKLRMTPGVEALAVAHLEDPDPQVVISAADTLGRYGSPASAQALRAQFDRWHRAWEGRQDELGYSLYSGSA